MVWLHGVTQITVALYRPCVRPVDIMLNHWISEGGCGETECQKVVVVRGCQEVVMGKRGVEEGGYGETGCQKVVMGRQWESEGSCCETLDSRRWLW
jgi:hypothetical protein